VAVPLGWGLWLGCKLIEPTKFVIMLISTRIKVNRSLCNQNIDCLASELRFFRSSLCPVGAEFVEG